MADNFDERSGLIFSEAPWGKWGQTIEDVQILIKVDKGTVSKAIKCNIYPKKIRVVIKENTILEGNLFDKVVADECIWTLEDREDLRITLVKVNKDAANCWKSLLEDKFPVDPWTFSEMEKKMVLERFQRENPGFDFSKSDVSGNFHGGGPSLPGQ
eukprot:gene826-10568_t